MEKKDNRVRVTKIILKEALINLLKKEPIKNITVKELCNNAGINRSTFYTYFYDVYDVLEQIEDEMYNELQEAINNNSFFTNHSIYYSIFVFFHNHAAMCEILLIKNTNSDFIQKALALGKKKFFELYEKSKIAINKLDYFYDYVANGMIGLLKLWLMNDMKESITEIAEISERLVSKGIAFLA